jgi:hypothetical protein
MEHERQRIQQQIEERKRLLAERMRSETVEDGGAHRTHDGDVKKRQQRHNSLAGWFFGLF